MRAYLVVIRSNLLKRKTYSFTLLVLTMLATIFMVTSIGIISKIANMYEQSYLNSGDSELIYGFTNEYYDESFITDFKNKEQVDSVEKETASIGVVSLENETPTTVFGIYNQSKRPYNLRNSSTDLQDTLKENEILIPLSFQDEYDYQVNDTITIGDIDYVVKGIFEDPIYGSPYYHTKRVLVSEKMLNQIKTKEGFQDLTFLNINLIEKYKNDRNLLKDTISELTNDFDKFQLLSFDQISLASMRTTVSRIILIILFAFSLFLFLILTIVIRYTIMASIEDDYSSLGIMKALGYKNRNITALLVVQYGLIILLGIALGLIGSYLITPILGTLLLRTSGILWKGNISLSTTVIVSMLIFLFSLFIVYIQTRKTGKISPIEAINLGKSDNSAIKKGISLFKSPFNRIPISIRMSLKQITTTMRQYLSLLILSIIFSFMILTVISLSGSFNSADKVASLLGYDLNDLSIKIANPETASKKDVDNLVEHLNEEYGVTYYSVYDTNSKIYADGNRTQLLVYNEFQTSNILEGRSPEKANEIIISQGVSDDLDKKLGEKITISLSGDSEKIDYEVVGINNQIYRMGKSISMMDSGFKELYDDFSPSEFLIKLKNNSNLEKTIDKVNTQFLENDSGISISNELDVTMKRIDAIKIALSAISYAVIFISLILISIITLLVSIVLIKRETFELGILKSLGFTSRQIRTQFAIRFILITFLGSIIGIVLNIISDNILINTLFGVVNIVSIPSGLTFLSYIFCVCFIVLATAIFAWVVSRRIKVIEAKVLITE